MGTPQNFKVFGAGLLSSVGESQNVFSPKVKKLPLSVACTEMTYDITRPQPQLYVARDAAHLVSVLEELEQTLSCTRGGESGLAEALRARTTVTAVLDSGVAVSGQLESYRSDKSGGIAFLKFTGPSQLSWRDVQLEGHGPDYHAHGYSTPLGRLEGAPLVPPENMSDADLARIGVSKGAQAALRYMSGFTVSGTVKGWTRCDGKLAVMAFDQCTVTCGDEVFFKPEWGTFDLIFGVQVTSVYGGAADKRPFKDSGYGASTTTPGRQSPVTANERASFDVYQKVRELRARLASGALRGADAETEIEAVCAQGKAVAESDDWLLSLECLEIANQGLGLTPATRPWLAVHAARLTVQSQAGDGTTQDLINKGLRLTAVPD